MEDLGLKEGKDADKLMDEVLDYLSEEESDRLIELSAQHPAIPAYSRYAILAYGLEQEEWQYCMEEGDPLEDFKDFTRWLLNGSETAEESKAEAAQVKKAAEDQKAGNTATVVAAATAKDAEQNNSEDGGGPSQDPEAALTQTAQVEAKANKEKEPEQSAIPEFVQPPLEADPSIAQQAQLEDLDPAENAAKTMDTSEEVQVLAEGSPQEVQALEGPVPESEKLTETEDALSGETKHASSGTQPTMVVDEPPNQAEAAKPVEGLISTTSAEQPQPQVPVPVLEAAAQPVENQIPTTSPKQPQVPDPDFKAESQPKVSAAAQIIAATLQEPLRKPRSRARAPADNSKGDPKATNKQEVEKQQAEKARKQQEKEAKAQEVKKRGKK